MYKIPLAVVAVLVSGAALFFYFSADESSPQRPRGVVIESTSPPPVSESRSVAGLSNPLPAIRPTSAGSRLVIGRISSNVDKYLPRLQAMANYLSIELAGQGFSGVDIRMVDTLEEMTELFRNGEVDFVSETAFGAIELERDGLAEMMLLEWKGGVPSYTSIIFARRDSGIDSLDDLVGQSIAFEERSSTSAYLVPRSMLARAGFNMVELTDPRSRPPLNSIGFSFADVSDGGGGSAARMVLDGTAAAGAMSNLDWTEAEDFSEEDKRNLVIIHVSDPIIRSVLLVRSSLDPAIKARLEDIFLRMHESVAGQNTLEQYSKVARYEPMQGDALVNLMNARFMYETSGTF